MKPKPEYINGLFVREKHIQTQGGDFDFISVVVDVESFAQSVKQFSKIGKSGKKELKMKFMRRREESGTGITHSVVLDTWEPKDRNTSETDTKERHNQAKSNAYHPTTADSDEVPI